MNVNNLCYIILIFLKCVAAGELRSLTFVIDITPSMGDDISEVKLGADALIDTILADNESHIDNFILVTFKDVHRTPNFDKDTEVHVKSKNKYELKSALSTLSVVNQGSSCPEIPLTAIKRGLQESLPGSSIYVFTDATARDYMLFDEVKALAQDKQCQIVFVLTGMCSSNDINTPEYKVYPNLALATGGQVFNVKKGQLHNLITYVRTTIPGRRTSVVDTVLPPGKHNITFNTDNLMGELLISLTSSSSFNPTIHVADGAVVEKKLLFETDKAKVYTIDELASGRHIVEIGTTVPTSVSITAKDTGPVFDLGFSGVVVPSINDTSPRPISGQKSYLSISLKEGDFTLKEVQFLDMHGNVLQKLPLVMNNRTKLYTTPVFIPPSTTFSVNTSACHPTAGCNIYRYHTPIDAEEPLPGNETSKYPIITLKPAGMINVNYSEPLQITCEVNGYPKPEVVWKNRESGVILSHETIIKHLPSDFINVLSIKKAIQNATYVCEATNQLGTNIQEIAVQVMRPRYLKVNNTSGNTTIKYEENGNIFCIIDAYPPAVTTWYKDDILLQTSDNVEISHTISTLNFIKASPTIRGKYTCKASNEDTSQSADVFVTVAGLIPATIETPKSLNLNQLPGEMLILPCKASGVPKPEVHWKYQLLNDSKITELGVGSSSIVSTILTTKEGIYTCVANNTEGTSQITYRVNVVEGPVIDKSKTEYTVEHKSSTVLECIIQKGTPKPKINWYFRSGINDTAGKTFKEITEWKNKETTILENSQSANTGTYLCEAENNVTKDNHEIHLLVEFPATIVPPKSLSYDKTVGETLALTCNASGVPEPQLSWTYQHFKDSVQIGLIADKKIKLNDIQISHEGKYTCTANNTRGTSKITYTVNVFEGPVIDKNKTEYIVDRGLSTVIECIVKKGKPVPKINWYFRSGLNESAASTTFEEMPAWNNNKTIFFTNAQKNNTGTYLCEAYNDISKDEVEINLLVEYPPAIREVNNFFKYKVDQRVNLPCIVDGSPKPQVTWYFDNKTLHYNGNKHLTEKNYLTFKAKISDRGYYVCEAKNKLGSMKSEVKLVITEPPFIIKPHNTSMAVLVGSNLELPCSSKGDPKPITIWTYQSFSASKPSRKKIKKEEDGSLHLKYMQVSEAGYYKCTAANAGGSYSITYEIQIIAPPTIENIYKQKRFVAVAGDVSVQIICNATGSPRPTVTWMKDGSTLTIGSNYFLQENTLIIKDVPEDANGFYTCIAKNPRGVAQETYQVVVHKYPLFDHYDSIITIKKGTSKKLECPRPHKITDQLRWYRDSDLIQSGDFSLNHAVEDDSGYYACRVSNDKSSSTGSVKVEVV